MTSIEPGDSCLDRDCSGHFDIQQKPCYCAATHAPCGNCTDSWLECVICNARPEEFQAQINPQFVPQYDQEYTTHHCGNLKEDSISEALYNFRYED